MTTALIILSIACGWLLVGLILTATATDDTAQALIMGLAWPFVLAWILVLALCDELQWHWEQNKKRRTL